MRIIQTNIPDVTPRNLDESKLELANQIIRDVYPVFDEIYETRIDRIKELQKELAKKRRMVAEAKRNLQDLMDGYKRKKKISKLLDRIDKLVQSGLAYEGSLKHEITVLLKVVDKLSDDKLDVKLRETMNLLTRRFAK
jgi:predicted  nucleic acid-binding Zn-ribbon protein